MEQALWTRAQDVVRSMLDANVLDVDARSAAQRWLQDPCAFDALARVGVDMVDNPTTAQWLRSNVEQALTLHSHMLFTFVPRVR